MSDLKKAIINLEITEAYGLAIKVEEDGYALYQKAIELSDNERAKEDLKFLRDQEGGHKAFFEKLLQDTGKEYKADSDTPLYAWVKENLITPVQNSLQKNASQSYQDVLLIGLKLEEKSIQFYKELKKATQSKDNKKAISKIIKEERRHKKFLIIVKRYSKS